MRRRRSRTLLVTLSAVLLGLTGGLAGCGRPAIVDRRPVAPIDARPASLLAMVPAAETADTLPWYFDRNDYGPTVLRGQSLGSVEYVSIWTYDRQSTSHGQVRDHYHQTTRRHRFHGQTQP